MFVSLRASLSRLSSAVHRGSWALNAWRWTHGSRVSILRELVDRSRNQVGCVGIALQILIGISVAWIATVHVGSRNYRELNLRSLLG